MTAPLFKGVITALITPLRDGNVDEAALERLIERQIAAGIHGVVAVGTTGEGGGLTIEEHKRVTALCVRVAAGRIKVIAGAGSPATYESIDLAAHGKACGCDGSLVVTPYYNRPSQAGLIAHFEAVADAVQLPMIAYNVPGRTGVDLSNESVARLSAHPNIVGLKDATGDMGRVSWMHSNIVGSGAQFDLITGDDHSFLGYMAHGGVGLISVTSNVAPEAMVAIYNAIAAGDYATARAWQDRLIGLHKALFLDASPAPAKYALAKLGLCTEEMRLPLVPTSDAAKPVVDAAMAAAGIVS